VYLNSKPSGGTLGMSESIIRTYKIPVPLELYKTCYRLNKTAARIYNKTISFIRKMKEKHDSWVSLGTVKKYILRWSDGKIDIHTHSKQVMVEQYFQALNSYFKAVKKNPN
jgi:putative transposase